AASCSPDRIFKVVFVGNSGVGKSSFIHRFCYDRFLAELNATMGIDYQVKSLMVDDTQVALQLWDTAGQERFRSITRQYFRKADGILVMYDVTAKCSFTAVRNWMSSVQ
ncbi:RAB44 protein, partial [Bucorvus abyssinicus]|nr:RAB44 protein [Bucorvus abyssinicus]